MDRLVTRHGCYFDISSGSDTLVPLTWLTDIKPTAEPEVAFVAMDLVTAKGRCGSWPYLKEIAASSSIYLDCDGS